MQMFAYMKKKQYLCGRKGLRENRERPERDK